MHHRNAPLTVVGRQRAVAQVIDLGRPIAHVAAEFHIARTTLSKWVGRYRDHGEAGLEDHSSAPANRPTRLPIWVLELIESWRRKKKWSARRIARELADGHGFACCVRTVTRWLDRLGLNRIRDITPDGENLRSPGKIVARYPGHMVHMDVKKVGKLRDGGGWWAHGRGSVQDKKKHGQRVGYTYLHSIIDGFSRLAYTEALEDEKAATTIGFFHRARVFFAAHGITKISRLVTDNGSNYTAKAFRRSTCAFIGRHQRTRIYTPRHNGKIERYQRILTDECLYARPYASENERREAIAVWVHHYDYHRPHTACGDQPPASRLHARVDNVMTNYTYAGAVSSLLRIVRFTRALAPLYTAIILCSVLTAVAGLAVPFLIGHATDTVAGAVNGSTPTGTAVRTVLLIAGAVLAAELAVTVVSNIGGWFGDVMSNRMRTILSVRYYDKLLHLPQRWFDGEITGTIVARLNRSITEITNFTKMMSNSFASMLITTAAVLAISAWYAWPLAVLLLIVFPVYVWLTSLTSVKWQRLEGAKNEQIDIASGRFAEVVGQIRVVKSFVRERGELADFSRRFRSTDATTREQSTHWHRMDVIRRAFLNLVFFGVYAIIFVRTVQGAFSLGEMVLLVQLMSMAKAPVESMSWVIDSAQRAIAGSRDYFRVMETPVDPRTAAVMAARPSDARDAGHADGTAGELPETARGAAAAPASGAATGTALALAPAPAPAPPVAPVPGAPVVAFRDVSFAYEDGEDVLHGIDFEVDRGEKIALVGESGGGKSTIVNLLLGLYEPRRGSVEVVGRPSAELPLDQLRERIGVVFQDASLFSGTIRENIAYGRPEASDEEVAEAARRANADAFILRFPEGYSQVIGERGLKLSGGQRQRIAVARAILKDAPVLVLDEATSALDTKAEIQVQKGLDELMDGRTSLIIAHRLSTIAEVDRIITLRDGRIDEIGSPAELAASGGIYAQLLALQSSGDSRRLARFDITG